MLSILATIWSFLTGSQTRIWLMVGVIGTAAAFILLGPKFSEIGAFLGFETKAALKKELKQEQANNAVLKEADKTNQETIAVLEGTNDNLQDSFEKKTKTETKIDKRTRKLVADAATAVELIKVDPILTPEQKDVEIAKVQMTSIWKAYCDVDNSDPQCKQFATEEAPAT
jgi:hypothetical protein